MANFKRFSIFRRFFASFCQKIKKFDFLEIFDEKTILKYVFNSLTYIRHLNFFDQKMSKKAFKFSFRDFFKILGDFWRKMAKNDEKCRFFAPKSDFFVLFAKKRDTCFKKSQLYNISCFVQVFFGKKGVFWRKLSFFAKNWRFFTNFTQNLKFFKFFGQNLRKIFRFFDFFVRISSIFTHFASMHRKRRRLFCIFEVVLPKNWLKNRFWRAETGLKKLKFRQNSSKSAQIALFPVSRLWNRLFWLDFTQNPAKNMKSRTRFLKNRRFSAQNE